MGADMAYVSADGQYLFAGDLFEIDTRANLTESAAARAVARKLLAKLDERDMIVFSPTATVKHTITVFTDVECGYCRKLHGEIDQLNKLGVRVRYAGVSALGPGHATTGARWKRCGARRTARRRSRRPSSARR